MNSQTRPMNQTEIICLEILSSRSFLKCIKDLPTLVNLYKALKLKHVRAFRVRFFELLILEREAFHEKYSFSKKPFVNSVKLLALKQEEEEKAEKQVESNLTS